MIGAQQASLGNRSATHSKTLDPHRALRIHEKTAYGAYGNFSERDAVPTGIKATGRPDSLKVDEVDSLLEEVHLFQRAPVLASLSLNLQVTERGMAIHF
jgi:hypothetical protein